MCVRICASVDGNIINVFKTTITSFYSILFAPCFPSEGPGFKPGVGYPE